MRQLFFNISAMLPLECYDAEELVKVMKKRGKPLKVVCFIDK